MTIGDRVRKARLYAKLTQVQLASKVDTSQGAISDIENNRNKESASLFDIAKVTKVSADWLINNQGEMIPLNYGLDNIEEIGQPKLRKAPILNYVQAGVFTDIYENTYDEYEYFVDEGNFSDNVYWLRLKGDSMNPIFWENDLVLVDANKQPKAGDYVIGVVDSENKATFKKYKVCWDDKKQREYCQLIPLNDFYAVVDSRYKPIHIRGVAVKHERFLR